MAIAPLLYNVFAAKAPATVVGWIWKAALVLTLKTVLHRGDGHVHVGIRDARSSDDMANGDKNAAGGPLAMLVGRYMVFLLLLLTTALVSRRVEYGQMAPTHKKTLLAGLALIPAWAFKDVVVSFCGAVSDAAAVGGHHGEAITALLVLCIATSLSCVLPVKEEGAGFCRSSLAMAGGCMGLGVAYAINLIFKDGAGDLWSQIGFQLLYGPCMTCAMVVVRPSLSSSIEAASNGISKRILTFLLSTTGFLVAWTWAALLDDVLAHIWPASDNQRDATLRQFVWTWVVTLTMAIVVPLTVPSDEERQRRCTSLGLTELVTVAAGVVVGGTWTDLSSAIYDLWTSNNDKAAVLKCWALVAALTILMPLLSKLLASILLKAPESPPTRASDAGEALQGSQAQIPSSSVELQGSHLQLASSSTQLQERMNELDADDAGDA